MTIFAVGGGLEITMASDFVIAAERAAWGMPEVDSGITPGWGGTTRMARYIDRRRTAQGCEMLSAGLSGAVNGAWKVADADQGAGEVLLVRP